MSETLGMSKTSVRAHEIDGTRGWAAVVVLLGHAFGEMLKESVPSLRSSLLAPFFASDLAVTIFFILSGDALSIAYFSGGGDRMIDRLLVRRYLRLTIPIAMSCLLTFIIMIAGFDYHAKAAVILNIPDWLGSFLQFPPSIFSYLKYSLIGVYVSHTKESSYNPFLWTMSIELCGSMMVFLFCYIWRRLRHPELVCIVVAIWLAALGSFYCLFVGGLLLGSWRQRGIFDRLLESPRIQVLGIVVVVVCVGGLIVLFHIQNQIIHRLSLFLLAYALVLSIYSQRSLKTLLSSRLSIFFGEISFPLYLVHFQVLISLMSWLVVREFARQGSVDKAHLVGYAIISVAVSIVLAAAFRQLERHALNRVDSAVLQVLA